MRKVTAEERDLFVAALAGKLPAKTVRAVAKVMARKAAEHAPPETVSAKTPGPAGRRRASDEEVLLFLEAIGLRSPAIIKPAKPPPPAPSVKLAGKSATGLDGNTKRKLDKGEIAPDAKLDLHGLTEAAAHGTLLTFLIAAKRRGDRLVLVVTGKGESGRGVLRSMVPRWLAEAPMKKIVAGTAQAHRRHGGDGALYVYLRKNTRG